MGLSLSHLTFLRVHVRHAYGIGSLKELAPFEGAAVVAEAMAMGLAIMFSWTTVVRFAGQVTQYTGIWSVEDREAESWKALLLIELVRLKQRLSGTWCIRSLGLLQ